MAALTRSQTNVEGVETTPFAHKYLQKRPRMRQRSTSDPSSARGLTEGLNLGRFQIFSDLNWVGIIGNLAQNFSDHAFGTDSTLRIGEGVYEFIVLFLIAWRIRNGLHEFMSKYHTNNLVERLFVVWIIILAMLHGNNAPYLLDTRE